METNYDLSSSDNEKTVEFSEVSSFETFSNSSNDIGDQSLPSENDFEEGNWKIYDQNVNFKTNLPIFKEKEGPYKNLASLNEPIEFFGLFLDDDFLQKICENTDLYYQAYKNQKNRTTKRLSDSHKKKWTKPDLDELKAFFGILLYMGIIQKPKIEDYWSSSILVGTPGIAQILSCDHFVQILRSLSYTPGRNNEDPLHKIHPLKNQIISVSKKLYGPSKYLTIDEGMIKFNGRHKMKVYMPLKPIKFGFKVYMIAESNSGFVLNWKIP